MNNNGKIKKTVIITGYACNNMCKFCIDSDKRKMRNKTTGEIIAEMFDAKKRGTVYLELIGGEVTIRPDAIKLVKTAKDMGFETIAMATNGRMFSYEEFAKKIMEVGLNHIIFSIHGHNEKLHDSLTAAKGSFRQLISGLKNVKKYGKDIQIGSNTTIVKQNYKNLEDIAKFIYKRGISNAEYIFIDPSYGAAFNDFYSFVPRISEAAPYIKKCLDIGKNNGADHWTARYVPLCYFDEYLDQVSELQERKLFSTEHLAPDFSNFDVENSRILIGRAKGKNCIGCGLSHMCEGIWKEYLKNYGEDELKPLP